MTPPTLTHHHSLRHAISLCSCLVIFWVFVASFFALLFSVLAFWLASQFHDLSQTFVHCRVAPHHTHTLTISSLSLLMAYLYSLRSRTSVHHRLGSFLPVYPSSTSPAAFLPSSPLLILVLDSTLSYTHTFRSHCLLLLLHLHDTTRVNRRT